MFKKIIKYFNLKKKYDALMAKLQSRMVVVRETMDLKEVTDVYAKYVCQMHGWYVDVYDHRIEKWALSASFCEVSFSFMNGYIKALHDNRLEFQNGMVKKRDISNDMPCGALKYYREDAIKETKEKAVETLQKVLEKYETSKANINTIVSAFKEEIKI